MRAARGAALLLVLWLVLLLSGLVAGYALSARVESMQGNGVARAMVAQEAARAGIEYAASRLLDPDPARRWVADGRSYRFALDGIAIDVAVRDEAGKIDLNAASFDLLQAFFEALGEPRAAATRLAAAVVDWRDADSLGQPAGSAEDADYAAAGLDGGAKDAPFDTVSELAQVLGMRPALQAAAAPHLTVYGGRALPDAGLADAVVRKTLGLSTQAAPVDPAAPPAPGSGTYSIESRARLADGRSARWSVVLRMGSSGLPGSTYTTLHWAAGEP
ncbi:general secretion pathway protein GspK [Thermomonas fusca]|uniref:General secretion pathway protein GspK n=1 Tax=Thermomonas fusca TaxID=215690 RepID=A0A5R9PCL2_9GAMM|nr:type II secretion system protein GspK [Thermomonas fusca]TLX20936.1 general secretion pathway protein GspK [Thermomonas fusca]